YALEDARPFTFDDMGDRYGWVKGEDGKYHVTLFIQNGRVLDTEDFPMKTGLRKIAEIHKGDFRLTANQNVIIGGVSEEQRPTIEKLLK
ncbi:sulfite reductase, partial [bacterium LRH843]|nr:sulfite reductase [bacterium LRH843]